MAKPTKWLCAQRRVRSAWASAQSDQSLRCPHEKSFGPKLSIMRTAKTLIRLGGCPGWSESSLGAHSLCWFCHVAVQNFGIIVLALQNISTFTSFRSQGGTENISSTIINVDDIVSASALEQKMDTLNAGMDQWIEANPPTFELIWTPKILELLFWRCKSNLQWQL